MTKIEFGTGPIPTNNSNKPYKDYSGIMIHQFENTEDPREAIKGNEEMKRIERSFNFGPLNYERVGCISQVKIFDRILFQRCDKIFRFCFRKDVPDDQVL